MTEQSTRQRLDDDDGVDQELQCSAVQCSAVRLVAFQVEGVSAGVSSECLVLCSDDVCRRSLPYLTWRDGQYKTGRQAHQNNTLFRHICPLPLLLLLL